MLEFKIKIGIPGKLCPQPFITQELHDFILWKMDRLTVYDKRFHHHEYKEYFKIIKMLYNFNYNEK